MTSRRGEGAIRAIALLPVLFWCDASAATELDAQEAIASDRPGIGSGAVVLGAGTIQLETGFELSHAGGPGEQTAYSFGQALVRVGFSPVEVEVFLNSLVVTDRGDNSVGSESRGLEDAGLGVKLPLLRDPDSPLTVSLQGVLTVPTGAEELSTSEGAAAVNALADVALGDRAALSVNVGHERVFDLGEGVTSVIVTPALSLGSGFGAYGGWAGFFADGTSSHIAEAGLTYVPVADIQLDVNGGWDTDRPSDEWFVGVGFAKRWGGRE